MLIKDKSLRHDKDKGPSASDMQLSITNKTDMNIADDSNGSATSLDLLPRPLYNPPPPPSLEAISTKGDQNKMNTQSIEGFIYTNMLEHDAFNTDADEHSSSSFSSPTPNEKGIWGQRPKLDLNVLTQKDMALITVTAFGREDISDYLLEVYLLALFLVGSFYFIIKGFVSVYCM